MFGNKLLCREKCCIDKLLYNEKCFYCRNIVRFIKIFDFRKCINSVPMTEDEFCKYHAPVAFGSEGSVVIGLYPVMKRVFLELFCPCATVTVESASKRSSASMASSISMPRRNGTVGWSVTMTVDAG